LSDTGYLPKLDTHLLLDGLGQGIMLFDDSGALILANAAIREMLGRRLEPIERDGWDALVDWLDGTNETDTPDIDAIHAQATAEKRPIRFHIDLDRAYTPCWLSTIDAPGEGVLTQVCLERPDWHALAELMGTFRNEARMAITATRGHADLLAQLAADQAKHLSSEQLAGRVLGFAEIMASHMYRLEALTDLLYRWEIILTGQLGEDVATTTRQVELAEWIEDYLESLVERSLVDPELNMSDFRERLTVNVADELYVTVSPRHLGTILRDLLRNAVLYSEENTPIILQAVPVPDGQHLRIDIVDRGYGIRETQTLRVFAPFQRAYQPQIMARFGYGLSLYLCKTEIEAMGGSLTFNSEEGVGSVFSLILPTEQTAWPDTTELT
jgi:signal transduction histidine kinase